MSTKQAAVKKTSSKAPETKTNEQEAQKESTVATAAKTLAELLQAKAQLESSIQEALSVEKPNAIARIKDEIKLYGLTPKDLGFTTAASPATTDTSTTLPGTSDRAKLKTDLKSTLTDKTSIWLANPPKFLEEEGAFKAFADGKSIDGWLVDPTDNKSRDKFLFKLSEKTDFKVQPNKEQLGSLWSEKWQDYSATNKNKK